MFLKKSCTIMVLPFEEKSTDFVLPLNCQRIYSCPIQSNSSKFSDLTLVLVKIKDCLDHPQHHQNQLPLQTVLSGMTEKEIKEKLRMEMLCELRW